MRILTKRQLIPPFGYPLIVGLVLVLLVISGCFEGGNVDIITKQTSDDTDISSSGGDGIGPDDNIYIVTFDGTSSDSSESSANNNASLLADFETIDIPKRGFANNYSSFDFLSKTGARFDRLLSFSTKFAFAQSFDRVRWLSQHVQMDSEFCYEEKKKYPGNAYCGFASVLMGADYLLNGETTPKAPATLGYSDDTSRWIVNSVKDAFKDKYSPCGGLLGILPDDDIPTFAKELGVSKPDSQSKSDGATPFDKTSRSKTAAEEWLRTALNNRRPVVARIPYQGNKILGQKSRENYFSGGTKTVEMKADPKSEKDPESVVRHWILIAEINDDTVLTYDPDPHAKNEEAGIRRYTKSSFFEQLVDNRNKSKGRMFMYQLCADCESGTEAFAAPAQGVTLSLNHLHTAGNSTPIVSPLVPNCQFSSQNMPPGLSLDTEGRINGTATQTGSSSPTIIMQCNNDNVNRVATKNISMTIVSDNLNTTPGTDTIASIDLITLSKLKNGKVGNIYSLPLSTSRASDSLSFSVIDGKLPPGLNLTGGTIVGKPTLSGTYSFDIRATISTASATKNFTIVVDPQTDALVIAPTLNKIQPDTVLGKNGQQLMKLVGSGFSDGSRVRLVDITNNVTYEKSPVSVKDAEIEIRANFSTDKATWTATVVGPTGLESAPVSFSVLAPSTEASRPIVWPRAWTQPLDDDLRVTAEYGAFGKDCSNADLTAVYTYYLDSGRLEHLGLDLSAAAGKVVKSIAPGKVIYSGKMWTEKWADVILVEHWTTSAETFTAVYGHLNSSVKKGDEVKAGDQLGTVYNLPSPYGSHLHFGVAKDRQTSVPGFSSDNNSTNGACTQHPGVTINPETFLQGRSPADVAPTNAKLAIPINLTPGSETSPGSTVGSGQVTLSWSSVTGATYYEVIVKDTDTGSSQSTTVKTTSYSSNLVPGKKYQWYVSACNGNGCSKHTLGQYFQTPGDSIPDTPTIDMTNSVFGSITGPGTMMSSTSVSLSWSTMSRATRYELGVRDVTTNNLVVDTSIVGTSYTANLDPEKQYKWNVAACNSSGCSKYTTPIYFQTPKLAASFSPPVVTLTDGQIGSNPPVPVAGTLTVNSGSSGTSGTLSANNPDGGSLTYSIVTNGSKGVATITNSATGAYTYAPNAGSSGTDTFTFKVNNGKVDSNVATITVTITPDSAVVPTITSLSPTSMTASGTQQTLTINGSNFVAGNLVQFKWGVGSEANIWKNSTSTPSVTSNQISLGIYPGTVSDTIHVRVCTNSDAINCSSQQSMTVTSATSFSPPVVTLTDGQIGSKGIVAKTGQTTSYAAGDDGALQKGVAWPNPRFTDNSNGTVTDNLTGLIWLKSANCFNPQDWTSALATAKGLANGQCDLADGSVAGDWRLPNINELESLVDYSHHWLYQEAGYPFSGVRLSHYWSGSTHAHYTSGAWYVHLGYGIVYHNDKANSNLVWPVRGGE
ncbi:MAG: DUF1566 domain-containing protein [Magnetococcales bacterium]|nr:DUF1566 domain-containing protein [Magnetococcales bacterium]